MSSKASASSGSTRGGLQRRHRTRLAGDGGPRGLDEISSRMFAKRPECASPDSHPDREKPRYPGLSLARLTRLERVTFGFVVRKPPFPAMTASFRPLRRPCISGSSAGRPDCRSRTIQHGTLAKRWQKRWPQRPTFAAASGQFATSFAVEGLPQSDRQCRPESLSLPH
jgi:hypothetical protein